VLVRRASDDTVLVQESLDRAMTTLSIDGEGVDVVYEGTEFRLERELIEEAVQKSYWDVTDHEILQMVEEDPTLGGEPRRVGDIVQ
jgi:hypothetical protein